MIISLFEILLKNYKNYNNVLGISYLYLYFYEFNYFVDYN